jgi:hypothetical protein
MVEEKFWIELVVEKTETTANLWRNEEKIESVVLTDARALAEQLLPAIDNLLKCHGVEKSALQEFTVESTLPEGYSARRIAESVARVFESAMKAVRKKEA